VDGCGWLGGRARGGDGGDGPVGMSFFYKSSRATRACVVSGLLPILLFD